jgi:WhiB family redox-sensing transcriptional regulator
VNAFDAFRLHEGLSTFAELLNRPEWHADALCREHDPALFFPEQGQSNAEAKAICARCLCADECREYAVAHGPELVGIWAGMSALERRRLRATAA